MYLTVTIKCEAESKAELLNTLPSQFQQIRQLWTDMRQEELLGPKDKIDLRFLIVGGGWRQSPADLATEVAQEPQGPPSTEEAPIEEA